MDRRLSWLLLPTLAACAPAAGPACGDGLAQSAEVCDGLDLQGASCASLGFGGGALRCASGCQRFDTSACLARSTDGGAGPSDGGAAADAGSTADAGSDAGATPPPDAGATPPPDAGVSRALVVRGGVLQHPDGRAVDVRGAVSCCGGAFGWPLFDEPWVDLVSSYGANFLHLRLGPFMTTTPNGETDQAATGGGYVEAQGRADLTRFNAAFWARLRALLQYARDRGLFVEVDVIDGWAIKHCRHGDLPGYSAWEAASNTQAQDVCGTAGSAAIAPGSVPEAWVRKVVLETGAFDNVLYQDGNELGLVAGYSPAWSTSMAQLIRAEERAHGYPRHLFGTNSGLAATMQDPTVDFVELHQNDAASPSQCAGKPCLVNEYNPTPSLTAAQFHQRWCAARQAGTVFWYWRHDQDAAVMAASLASMSTACP